MGVPVAFRAPFRRSRTGSLHAAQEAAAVAHPKGGLALVDVRQGCLGLARVRMRGTCCTERHIELPHRWRCTDVAPH